MVKLGKISIILLYLITMHTSAFAAQSETITVTVAVNAFPSDALSLESNIGNDRFTVSWITDTQETAQINYGATASLGNVAYDIRGELYEGTTHYITITDLSPNTTYYYDIVSGGVTYDNGGDHYTTITGSLLSPAADFDIVYGEVFLSDGITPAEGAIVYIRLSDNDNLGTSGYSQICSSLVDNTGYWYFNLKNIRTQTLDLYFDYSETGDNLILEVKYPNGEVNTLVVDTSEDSPAPPM